MLTIVDDKDIGFTLGASDYMTKPIDRERVATMLKKYRRDSTSRVLVVEDDLATRQMMRRMLEKEGWNVIEAANGRIGLERMAQATPELVLLDLMMPEVDGFEFVTRVRERAEWRTIPIVVITAKDTTTEDRLRLNGSVEKIIQKGAYNRTELLEQVRQLLVSSVRQTQPVD